MASMNEAFSDDIIANILSRLPSKEVARLRIICKRWRAVTSEHHFLRTISFSSSRSTNSSCSSVAGLFLSDRLHHKFRYAPLHPSHHVTPAAHLSFVPSDPAVDKREIYVSGSSNGLLLCSRPPVAPGNNKRWKWFVCNPLTRRFAEIDDVPDGVVAQHLFLAYDPAMSRHYKVIGFSRDDIHAYCSQTRSWRVAIGSFRTMHPFRPSNYPFRGFGCPRAVSWNASLVWVMSDRLVRLLVDDERVVGLPMPRKHAEGRWSCAYVGASGGCLQMIGFTDEERRVTGFLDVLEMQESSSPQWSVLYRVDLRSVVQQPEVAEAEQHPYHRTWRTRPASPYMGLRFAIDTGRHDVYLHLWPMLVVRGGPSTEENKEGQHGAGAGLLVVFSVPGRIMCYSTDNRSYSAVPGQDPAPSSSFYLASFQFSWHNVYPYIPSMFEP